MSELERSYFITHHKNGDTFNERTLWTRLRGKGLKSSPWDHLREQGRLRDISCLEFITPRNQPIFLPNYTGSYRYIQFTISTGSPSTFYYGTPKGVVRVKGTHDNFQVVGCITNKNGDCTLIAYSIFTQNIIVLSDNVKNIQFEHIGSIDLKGHHDINLDEIP